MNKTLILVVEDDRPIRNLIVTTLKTHDYKYLAAENGASAILEASSHNPDIVLLDLGLPDMEGVEVIKKIRTWSNMPIIVISARSEDTDKIEALDAGADDYITKPFDMEEVLARIESNLRRVQFQKDTPTYLRHGDLILDLNDNTAFLQGSELTLTAKEFAILELLMKYPDKIFSKANLFQSVWNTEYISEDNTLNVHISNLRNKLKAVCPDKDFIDTVWGIGYRLHKARD